MSSLDLATLTVKIEDEYDVDIFEDGLVSTVQEIIDVLKRMSSSMKIAWVDTSRNISKTYEEFYNDIVKKGDNNTYLYRNNPYDVFVQIFRNFICRKVSMLLDADFTEVELNEIELSKQKIEFSTYEQSDKSKDFKSFSEILEFIKF